MNHTLRSAQPALQDRAAQVSPSRSRCNVCCATTRATRSKKVARLAESLFECDVEHACQQRANQSEIARSRNSCFDASGERTHAEWTTSILRTSWPSWCAPIPTFQYRSSAAAARRTAYIKRRPQIWDALGPEARRGVAVAAPAPAAAPTPELAAPKVATKDQAPPSANSGRNPPTIQGKKPGRGRPIDFAAATPAVTGESKRRINDAACRRPRPRRRPRLRRGGTRGQRVQTPSVRQAKSPRELALNRITKEDA